MSRVPKTNRSLAPPLLLLGLTGCFYTFDNPVETKANGTIFGSIVIADAGAGLDPSGAQVSLLWTDLAVTVAASGDFTFLGLPDGVYTLKYVLDAGPGVEPVIGFRAGIELPREAPDDAEQTGDVLDLGRLVVDFAAHVTGTVDGLDGGTAVVGAFNPDSGLFESYSATTDSDGNYVLDLPEGSHEIWASSGTAAASVPVSLAAGSVVPRADIHLLPVPAGGPSAGDLVGDLVLGIPGYGAGATSAQVDAVFFGGSNIEINPPLPAPPSLASQIPGTGANMDQPLPPGVSGDVYCGLKTQPALSAGGGAPLVLNDLLLRSIPSFAGHPTNLGQITWLPTATFTANGAPLPLDYAEDAGGDAGADAGSDGGVDAGDAGAGIADAGPDAGGDGGPTITDAGIADASPGSLWQLLSQTPVGPAGSTTAGDTVIPVAFDGGLTLFYSNRGTVFAQQLWDGGATLALALAPDGGVVSLALVTAAAGSDGVPAAIVSATTAAGGPAVLAAAPADGGWALFPCGVSTLLSRGAVGLSPTIGTVLGTLPTTQPLYFIFLDGNGTPEYEGVQAANGSCSPAAQITAGGVPLSGYTRMASIGCQSGSDPALCLLLANSSGDVDAVVFDLPTASATPPVSLVGSTSSALPPASSLSLRTEADGTLLAAWSVLQGGTSALVYEVEAPVAALASGTAPQATVLDGGATVFGDPLALTADGEPVLVVETGSNGANGFVGSGLVSVGLHDGGVTSVDPDAGLLVPPTGGVDPITQWPSVGLAGTQGGFDQAQVWTYAP